MMVSTNTLIPSTRPVLAHAPWVSLPNCTPSSVAPLPRESQPKDRRSIDADASTRFGASLFGYDLGVISYVTVAPDFLRVTGLEEQTTQNENYLGFIVSSMLLG